MMKIAGYNPDGSPRYIVTNGEGRVIVGLPIDVAHPGVQSGIRDEIASKRRSSPLKWSNQGGVRGEDSYDGVVSGAHADAHASLLSDGEFLLRGVLIAGAICLVPLVASALIFVLSR